ncbi:hypothetical protein G6F31_015738 [Rhizopus arrhizus]|nr:hypothetical protein G6F31_015738 [Rhizopus arrhizus]
MPTRTPPMRWLPIMIGIVLSSTLGDSCTTSACAAAALGASGSAICWPKPATSIEPSCTNRPRSSNTST